MKTRCILCLLSLAAAGLLACDDVGEDPADAAPAPVDATPDGSDTTPDGSDGMSDGPDAMPDGSDAMLADALPPDGERCPAPAVDACAHCPIVRPAIDRTLYVSPEGDDDAGDGSAERPFGTLAHGVSRATPGTEVRLMPGTHPGGIFLTDVHGTAEAPIVIGGDPAVAQNPVIDAAGESEGLHLVRPRWVMLRKLTVRGAADNGINVDDGDRRDDPDAARFVAFRDLVIEDIGPAGNRDCLKLSGLDDFEVLDSVFRRCGDGGSGVDMVGCHDGAIRGNRFEDLGASGVQAKGGTARVRIANNRFIDAGARPINMGGSTGFEYFRPPLDAAAPQAEAREIVAASNLIVGGQTAATFVGCVGCAFAHNTVIEPGRWLLRVLQETTDGGGFAFEPARDGWVTGNVFVFRRDAVRTAVNVGPDTAPETFRFTHNLFYAVDDPTASAPALPVAAVGSITGRDPQLDDAYGLTSDSPAVGAGDPAARPLVDGSLAGGCYGDPPSLGASESPERIPPGP